MNEAERWMVVWSHARRTNHLLDLQEQGEEGRQFLCGRQMPAVEDGGPWWEEDELMAIGELHEPNTSVDEAVKVRVSCKDCLRRYQRYKRPHR